MYKKYQDARNASWSLLIDFKVSELPIKVSTILKGLGGTIIKYSEAQNFIEQESLEKLTQSSDGFTVLKENKYFIFYNQNCTPQRCRFTLAHELGHIILNHIKPNNCTPINNEPSQFDSDEEKQANILASRLLAPACVLHEMKVTTVEQIIAVCQISEKSAQFRLDRLQLLQQRNENFLSTKCNGSFYLNPLEKQVYNQFKKYINKTIL